MGIRGVDEKTTFPQVTVSFMVAYLCHTVRIYNLFPLDVTISTSDISYIPVWYSKSSNNKEAAIVNVWKNAHIRSLNTISANKINFSLLSAKLVRVTSAKLSGMLLHTRLMKMQAQCIMLLNDALLFQVPPLPSIICRKSELQTCFLRICLEL